MRQAFQVLPGVVLQQLQLMKGVETVFILRAETQPVLTIIVQTVRKLPDQNEVVGQIVSGEVNLAHLSMYQDPTQALNNYLQQLYAAYRKANADGKNPLWKPE